jgi:hypothetical protein
MIPLFDAEVVEFDIIPITLRLLKDPFSAGSSAGPGGDCATAADADIFHCSAPGLRCSSRRCCETAAGCDNDDDSFCPCQLHIFM